MNYRLFALCAGFLLDLVIGDPSWLPHPVVFIGKLIAALEKKIRASFPRTEDGERKGGILTVVLVCLIAFFVPFLILTLLYRFLSPLALILETLWCAQFFATKSLKTESMKVYEKLKHGTLDDARLAVSMIVGRDTQELSYEGVTKATVETIAENTSDGVIAPMLYMALGGVSLMSLYKAINTMDSMLGYKNDTYIWFGRCAAKLDDVANFVPARISGLLMCLAAYLTGKDGRNALLIFIRDRKNHASPNSAQTESAMAGALHVQLAGDAWYFGKRYEKPTIGDPDRPIEAEDIVRANELMYATAFLCAGICLVLMVLFL